MATGCCLYQCILQKRNAGKRHPLVKLGKTGLPNLFCRTPMHCQTLSMATWIGLSQTTWSKVLSCSALPTALPPSLAISPKRMGAVRLPSRAVPASSSSSHAQSCPRTHPGPFTSAHCLPAQAAIPFTNTGSHQLLPPPRKRCSL